MTLSPRAYSTMYNTMSLQKLACIEIVLLNTFTKKKKKKKKKKITTSEPLTQRQQILWLLMKLSELLVQYGE